jgi:hypothetical protein
MSGLIDAQLKDSDIISEDELLSNKSTPFESGVNITNVQSSTKEITVTKELELFIPQENDIVIITGGSAAGTYTFHIQTDVFKFTVKEVIPDASSGTAAFYRRSGAELMGFDNSSLNLPVSSNTIQKALEYLARQIIGGNVERRFYRIVAPHSSLTDDYVIPNGNTLKINEMGGSLDGSSDTRIEIIWDPLGTPEYLYAAYQHSPSQRSIRELVGDGTKILRLHLVNDSNIYILVGVYLLGDET